MISGEKALELVKSLSYSQGCWGRFLRELEENDTIEEFKIWVEEQQFKNELDLILTLEGN